MAFRMKLDDIFRVGTKKILTGSLDADEESISNAWCTLEMDGKRIARLLIGGEVTTSPSTPHRDLWTDSPIDLTRETIRDHSVWLISDSGDIGKTPKGH
jgi:hypothetical protein